MIYFARVGESGPVKVGCSTDPLQRLASLQTGHPERLSIIRLTDGDRREEGYYHLCFSDLHISGEWFRFDPRMLTVNLGLAEIPVPVMPDRKRPARPTAVSQGKRPFATRYGRARRTPQFDSARWYPPGSPDWFRQGNTLPFAIS